MRSQIFKGPPPFLTAGHGAVRLSGCPVRAAPLPKLCVVNGSRNTLVAVASPGPIIRKIGALPQSADRRPLWREFSRIPLQERVLPRVCHLPTGRGNWPYAPDQEMEHV